MTSYSSDNDATQTAYLVKLAEDNAYWSRYQECYVVICKCEKCKKWYEEERDAAKAKIRKKAPYLCLDCDKEAEEVSVTGTKVSLWKVPGIKDLWWRL